MIISIILFFGLGIALICPGAHEKKYIESWDLFSQVKDTKKFVIGKISNILLYIIKWLHLVGLLCIFSFVFTLDEDAGYMQWVLGIVGYIVIYIGCYKVTAILDRTCFLSEKGMWIYDLTKPMILYQDIELIQLRKTMNPAADGKGHLVLKIRYEGHTYKFVISKEEFDDELYKELEYANRQSEEDINMVLEWIEPMAKRKLVFEPDVFASNLGKLLMVGGICVSLIGGAMIASLGMFPFFIIVLGIICFVIGAFLYKKERLK